MGVLLDGCVSWLLPAACLGCGRPLPAGRVALNLCTACRGRLRRLTGHRCFGCGRALGPPPPVPPPPVPPPPVPAAPPACSRCSAAPPAFQRLLAVWSYEPPMDRVLRGLKFGRLEYLGEHLAAELARQVGGELSPADAVVPVPLHWRRRLSRGYNQAAAIAAPLAARLGLPLVPALARHRATVPQSRLGRAARRRNPQGVFRARSGRSVAGARVLLVDDVVTTGATLDAAAAALRRAGAARVVALAVARTPEA